MTRSNHFIHPSAAARYARSRPYFHPRVIERFRAFTGLTHCDHALDVACGTGQSTIALAPLADRILGIDISASMLARAPIHPRIGYLVGSAEQLPVRDAAFELVTVAMAYHWFDQDRFLAEAARVLRRGGWLMIYNNAFNGRMAEEENFAKWAWEVYPRRYPTPPRNSQPRTRDYADFGLRLRGEESYTNEVPMARDELVAYLLTQSNTIAAVEQGSETAEQAAEWIRAGVEPFFPGPPRTMQFGGQITYLQRI